MRCRICDSELNTNELYSLKPSDIIITCIEHKKYAYLSWHPISTAFPPSQDEVEKLVKEIKNELK